MVEKDAWPDVDAASCRFGSNRGAIGPGGGFVKMEFVGLNDATVSVRFIILDFGAETGGAAAGDGSWAKTSARVPERTKAPVFRCGGIAASIGGVRAQRCEEGGEPAGVRREGELREDWVVVGDILYGPEVWPTTYKWEPTSADQSRYRNTGRYYLSLPSNTTLCERPMQAACREVWTEAQPAFMVARGVSWGLRPGCVCYLSILNLYWIESGKRRVKRG